MKYRLNGKGEEELSSLTLARYFSALFRASGGNIGAALRMWIACIKKVRGDTFDLSLPTVPDDSALRHLRPEWSAVLTQLLLHKQLTEQRLVTISDIPRFTLLDHLGTLGRMGLVTETQKQVLEIHPAVVLPLAERLSKKGLLP
jgi:hypothetical protein